MPVHPALSTARSPLRIALLSAALAACSVRSPDKTAPGGADTSAAPTRAIDTRDRDDPPVARVNLRVIRRSELLEEVARQPDGSVRRALAVLTRRALLLQEADRSGLGAGLPAPPAARAQAFLERIVSSRVICSNVTEREIGQMYRTMKPRFVRGDLYRVAELRWTCLSDGSPEAASCRDAGASWAEMQWLPVVDAIETAEDVYWLGELTAGAGPIQYSEFTFHIAANGRVEGVPSAVALAIRELPVGSATVALADASPRLQVLIEHRPPLDRPLGSPGVREEVLAELCPRLVAANRSNYTDMLLESAHVELQRHLLPDGHDVPSGER